MISIAPPVQHLQPGEVLLLQGSGVISTILGSCVSVCLWDLELRIGGMNHVTLPVGLEPEAMSTRYANVGTYVLYDLMRDAGCKAERMKVHVYGGASGISGKEMMSQWSVGNRNTEVTLQVLQKLGLRAHHQSIRGNVGRKLHFNVAAGRIEMTYLQGYDFRHEQERTQVGGLR